VRVSSAAESSDAPLSPSVFSAARQRASRWAAGGGSHVHPGLRAKSASLLILDLDPPSGRILTTELRAPVNVVAGYSGAQYFIGGGGGPFELHRKEREGNELEG
jgi:hypothetical protein